MDRTCHACELPMTYEVINTSFPDIYMCRECDHIFRRYDGDVAEFHRDKYRSLKLPDGTLGYEFKPVEIRTKHINAILEKIGKFFGDSDDCLEIGFGDGVFTKLLTPRVRTVDCCEIDPDLATQAEEQGYKVYCKDILDLESVEYDTVLAFDVMEHILDIQQFKRKMLELTKSKLILQVPVKRKLKPPNRPQGFDGHCHYFSGESIKRTFEDDFDLKLLYVSEENEFAYGAEMLTVWEKL